MRNGPTQSVRVWSVPLGAQASVGDQSAETPTRFELERDRDHTVRVEMGGFESREVRIRHVPDEAVRTGNWLLLGIPLLWESGEASQYRLVPEEVDVHLDPIGWSPR